MAQRASTPILRPMMSPPIGLLPWLHVLSFLRFGDLCRMRCTSRMGCDMVMEECRRRVACALSLWIPRDYQDVFWAEIRAVEGVICGSFVLKILLPDVFNLSKSSFLDLMLPCNSFQGLKVVLFACGYTVVKDAQPRPAYNDAVKTRYLLYNPKVCEVLSYIHLHSFSTK